MAQTIQEFKAQLTQGGARPNLYRVTMPFPIFAGSTEETKNFSFLCRSAELPGVTVGNIPIAFRGRFINVPGDKTFAPWQVVVYNETNFKIRNAFEKWHNGINGHQTNIGLPPTLVQVDSSVEQLDRDQETVLKKYTMRDMYPTELGPIQLAYDRNNVIEEFAVSFVYNWWDAAGITT